MKPFLATASFVLLSICSVKAQLALGIKGGLSLSGMSIANSKVYPSFHAGAFSEVTLNENLMLRPELLYSVKGSRPTVFNEFDLVIDLRYISMPVLVGWKATDRLNILAGHEISYLMEGIVATHDQVSSAEIFTPLDFAIDLGLAYQISNKFTVEFRYSLGLVNVVDIEFTDLHDRPVGSLEEGKNRSMQLSLGYTFESEE